MAAGSARSFPQLLSARHAGSAGRAGVSLGAPPVVLGTALLSHWGEILSPAGVGVPVRPAGSGLGSRESSGTGDWPGGARRRACSLTRLRGGVSWRCAGGLCHFSGRGALGGECGLGLARESWGRPSPAAPAVGSV